MRHVDMNRSCLLISKKNMISIFRYAISFQKKKWKTLGIDLAVGKPNTVC